MERYNAKVTEKKWREKWEKEEVYLTSDDRQKKKYYVLEMFPYPSGKIHMGHVRNYTMGDVVARYKRHRGFNVLHPMGWDAFGMPAENAAIENDIHPATWTYKNISDMKAQLKPMGLSIDWSIEFATCDEEYYKFQQEMFIDMLENDLVYRKKSLVNWDPVDKTVLANEQVENGKGWRSGAVVEKKELDQWFFKITDYSKELLESLDSLPNWPEKVKTMQRNWIGKSVGASIIPAGKLSDKYGRKSILIYGGLIGCSSCYLLIIFHTPIMVLLLCCGIGLAVGSMFSAIWALTNDVISKDNAGNQIGLLAIGFLIAGLTSRIAGILIDFLNNRIENLGYFSLLAIAGSCFILGPMATFLIKGNIDESISNKS